MGGKAATLRPNHSNIEKIHSGLGFHLKMAWIPSNRVRIFDTHSISIGFSGTANEACYCATAKNGWTR